MRIKIQKKYWILVVFTLFFGLVAKSFAFESIAQSLQIYTHFKCVVDKPSWLLELRDMESGQVFPYLFDIHDNDNFWVAFSKEHSYRVVASEIHFGREAVIHNFCHLEDGVLRGKSMFITLSGVISPDRRTTTCHVEKYSDTHFTIVKPEDVAPPTPVTQTTTTTTTTTAAPSLLQKPTQAVNQVTSAAAPQTPAAPTTASTFGSGGAATAKSLVTSLPPSK